MGIRGRIPQTSTQDVAEKKSKPANTAHRDLCITVGKWLRKTKYPGPQCGYVAVEIVTINQESPDVFGWNYWATVMIEVKVSRADFIADAKKPFRINPDQGIGASRYYCCPEGMIKPEELPNKWGLLWLTDNGIVMIKEGERIHANSQSEATIFASIMRREGVKQQLFDYRKTKE